MSWIDDYVTNALPYSEAPKIFQEACAYWAAGTILGRSIYYKFGAEVVYPNMYLLMVGKSGEPKKSSARNFAIGVIERARPGVRLPDLGSPEAFRDSLESRNWFGYLAFDEFSAYLAKARRDYTSDMNETVMELFHYGPKSLKATKTSGEVQMPTDAVISFIAGSTTDTLVKKLRSDELLSGSMGRIMTILADADKKLPRPPELDERVLDNLADRIRGLKPPDPKSDPKTPILSVKISETPESAAYHDAIYEAIGARKQEIARTTFSSAFSRAQSYAIKIAMINAILDRRTFMIAADFEKATYFLREWAEGIAEISALVEQNDPFQRILSKLEAYLRAHPHTTKRDIQRYMRLKSYEIKEAMDFLAEQGLIECGQDMVGTKIAMTVSYKG